jgi:hypothetical protein
LNKLTLVLMGLFVMVSSMVGITAYVSNNQAFVKAQLLLSVDFGNVFPGTTATESFTIANAQKDTTEYTVTLQPPTPPQLDIRPYLNVWKDPAEETEPDGTLDGRVGDYTGTGSFTDPNDLSDKWMVTFTVPDVTLPAGTVLEYGCQIAITPKLGG